MKEIKLIVCFVTDFIVAFIIGIIIPKLFPNSPLILLLDIISGAIVGTTGYLIYMRWNK